MTVTVYTFEDASGVEQCWTTMNATEAQEHAFQHGYKCIANEFEWSDSEVAWDFTDTGIDEEE